MTSEPRNVRTLIAQAEHAASIGDLAAAEELLRDAAGLQERELGPLHPDLANTLNNLAIVAEKSGRPDDAQAFYRRAVAVASASLPPGDPMVATSRQNLEDFCNAHGLPIDRPAAIEPAAAAEPAPAAQTTPSLSPPAPRKASRAPATLAIGAVVVVAAALFIARPWSSRHASSAVPAPESVPAPAAEPTRPATGTLPPVERTPAPKGDRAPAPARAPDAIGLVTVQLCRNFSTRDWRCDPAGDSVVPGPLVFYTRVRSPREVVIVHRWYRGDTLRQSVQLKIGANTREGYRTYSRQTVDRGDWRLEVRSAAGDLLHEQHFAVR